MKLVLVEGIVRQIEAHRTLHNDERVRVRIESEEKRQSIFLEPAQAVSLRLGQRAKLTLEVEDAT